MTKGYHPEGWVIIKIINKDETIYKLLASMRGMDESWRLNSGITSIEINENNQLVFGGYSGSVYICNRDQYGKLNHYANATLNSLEKYNDNLEDTRMYVLSYQDVLEYVLQMTKGE